MDFPQHLRDIRPMELSDDDEAARRALSAQLRQSPPSRYGRHPPPHSPELLQAYIAGGGLPPGRYYIYGTGHLTRDALPALEVGPFEILGFLDRAALDIVERFGRPVILPEEAAGRVFDYILVLHLLDEEAMQARLLQAGIAPEQIIILQGDPRYQTFVADCLFERFRRSYPGQTPYLIISTLAAHWSIVPHRTLARLFPPALSAHLFMGSFGQIETYNNDTYQVFGCMQSVELLLRCINFAQPHVIYLKTSPHAYSEYLFIIIKDAFPNVKIINEINDWSSLFSDFFLKGSLLYRESDLIASRYSNYDALSHADLVVCKSGSQIWENFKSSFPVPCLTYFPLLGEDDPLPPPAAARSADEPIRVLFAGTIGVDETLDDASRSQGSNFLRYLHLLGSVPEIELDIFNSGHMSASGDHLFASVVAWLTDPERTKGRVSYHRLRPFAELMRMAARWDFGLAASHYAEDRVENVTRVGIGNKLMGYVAAGVPAIIDNRYGFASALISQFDAGVVIDPERMAELPDLLRTADRVRLRAGMGRLRAHLTDSNIEVRNALAALVAGA